MESTFRERFGDLVAQPDDKVDLSLASLLIAGLLLNRRRRRLAEESLWQKTEELDQFFNLSLELLSVANTDGYFLRLNPAWERILGYSREELMAMQFFDFVHPDDLDRTHKAVSTLASLCQDLLQTRYVYYPS